MTETIDTEVDKTRRPRPMPRAGEGERQSRSIGSADTLGMKATRALFYSCFPLSLSSPGITIAFGLVALVGIGVWRAEGMPAELRRVGVWMLSGYALLVLVDVLNGGGIDNFRLTALDYLPILAQVPFALALRYARVRPASIDRALQITIVIATVGSVAQWVAYGVERPGGLNLNPNPFSLVVAVWSTLLLARGLEQPRNASSVALALLGAVPILLAGSKIVWACTFLGFGYVAVRWAARRGRWSLLAAILPLIAAAAALAAATVASERLSAFGSELQQVLHGNWQGLSVGVRLEALVSGWRAFLDRPLLGYGFAERMQAAVDHATVGGPDLTMLPHLHNDYITHLVSFGIFGLLFLGMYLRLYVKIALHTAEPAYRVSGIAIVAALSLYMCFEVAFNMDPVSGMMGVHTGLLLAFMRRQA